MTDAQILPELLAWVTGNVVGVFSDNDWISSSRLKISFWSSLNSFRGVSSSLRYSADSAIESNHELVGCM